MGANAQTAVPAFVSGEILTAAEMTQVNTGIPVFATTVTRDAAFGGAGEKVLAQGQTCYIEATSTYQTYNGSAWVAMDITPGLVAIVPTSVATTGGGSSASANSVGKVTFTSAATLLLNGVFTSSYANYRIVLEGIGSAGGALACRMSSAGTANTTTNYNWQNLQANGGVLTASRTTGTTSFQISVFWSNVSGEALAADFFNPQTASAVSYNSSAVSSASGSVISFNSGHFTTGTSFDGIQLIPSSGTITGTISVYGYTA
jgi:hypothetical protein